MTWPRPLISKFFVFFVFFVVKNMIRIGIAGIGFMGHIHFLGAQKLRGAAVTRRADPATRG